MKSIPLIRENVNTLFSSVKFFKVLQVNWSLLILLSNNFGIRLDFDTNYLFFLNFIF